jgi:hypothetical protein
MDEPRLMSFARAAAGEGFAVLTPEIVSLADYRVDPTSIQTIGDSAIWLEKRLERGPPAVVGISFAGGLALLAACQPAYATHMRAITLMGAYDDLERVSRFLVMSQAELPDGQWIPHRAHDYGAAVFVYAHLQQFFPPAYLPVANEALRYWLWEEPQNAQPLLAKLSPPSRDVINALMARRIDVLRPQLLKAIETTARNLPRFRRKGTWRGYERRFTCCTARVLITPAFSHVDPDKDITTREKLRLVNFIAGVLRASR